jgi:predicted amidohydrolase
MATIRLGLAQIRQTEHLIENWARFQQYFARAVDAGVDLLVTPECHLSGYRVGVSTPDAPVEAERIQDCLEEVGGLCRRAGMACVFGCEIPNERGKPFNSAVIFDETGARVGVHHKTKLVPLDKLGYDAGAELQVYTVKGTTIGVVICFEGFRFPETTRALCRQGARLVLHPQNNTTWDDCAWKIPVHESLIVARAAENTVWFASCNAAWPFQNCASMVVSPDGLVRAKTFLQEETLLVYDVDPSLATHAMLKYDEGGDEAIARMVYGASVEPLSGGR